MNLNYAIFRSEPIMTLPDYYKGRVRDKDDYSRDSNDFER